MDGWMDGTPGWDLISVIMKSDGCGRVGYGGSSME